MDSLCDLFKVAPQTRLAKSPFMQLEYLKYWIAIRLVQDPPYRFEKSIKSIIKGF